MTHVPIKNQERIAGELEAIKADQGRVDGESSKFRRRNVIPLRVAFVWMIRWRFDSQLDYMAYVDHKASNGQGWFLTLNATVQI